MNEEWQQRTALLYHGEELQRLRDARVVLFGLGGVGSYTAEALARIGIGHLTLVDSDTVALSNLNRQLPALHSTIGERKVDVVARRIRDINPEAEITALCAFYLPESPVELPEDCAAVADAIDTVSAKIHLAQTCARRGIPLVSCMGMGNRYQPTQIRTGDLFETSGCPLCRRMRHELRKRGIYSLQTVYSTEPAVVLERPNGEKSIGSLSFVPSVAGLFLAYEIVNAVLKGEYVPRMEQEP